MQLADGIRKHGFRKWYERELLQSHAHMTLAFVCLIAIFAAFEAMSEGTNQKANVLAIMLCTGVGAWAIRRYVRLLTSAEAVANQADCPSCGTYARFRLIREATAGPDRGAVCVHCKQCEHEWTIAPV
jgi:formate dehydrogenase maturation protein FdhE